MKEKLRFLGLDVHAETIAVAVAKTEGDVRSMRTIPNHAESIRKLIKSLGPADKLRACNKAGPTGYVVYWQLAKLGVVCEVVAPTLLPVKAGDRVKTSRRDAEKLPAPSPIVSASTISTSQQTSSPSHASHAKHGGLALIDYLDALSEARTTTSDALSAYSDLASHSRPQFRIC